MNKKLKDFLIWLFIILLTSIVVLLVNERTEAPDYKVIKDNGAEIVIAVSHYENLTLINYNRVDEELWIKEYDENGIPKDIIIEDGVDIGSIPKIDPLLD